LIELAAVGALPFVACLTNGKRIQIVGSNKAQDHKQDIVVQRWPAFFDSSKLSGLSRRLDCLAQLSLSLLSAF
jgi:hypothetical protein